MNRTTIGSIFLIVVMPFVASFHVSIGAPWILTTALSEVIFFSIFVWTSDLEGNSKKSENTSLLRPESDKEQIKDGSV